MLALRPEVINKIFLLFFEKEISNLGFDLLSYSNNQKLC